MTHESIKAFLLQIKRKLSPGTYNLKRQQLKNLLKQQPEIRNNYALREVVNEMFRDMKSIDVSDQRAKQEGVDYLTKQQIDLMLNRTTNAKHRLIIEFLFRTGCRVSEMLNIRLADTKMNLQSSKVTISVVGKGSKARNVFVTWELFARTKEEFDGDPYLFGHNNKQYSRKHIHRIISKTGERIDYNIHPHTLRHSFAMYLSNHGKNVKYVSRALGHASTQVTADMYFHETPGEEITDLFAR